MTTTLASQQPLVTRDPPVRIFRQLAVVFVAGLFIYGWKLGTAPIAGTEPLRALVAHQMVQSGDVLIPSIYGELYLRKPPLQYWIVAAAEKIAGVGNEFIWRLPSAIGSAFLAVFLAWWTARWFGDRARLIAGFSCLALIALWAQDRGGDIDALDTFASILAACCILEIGFGPTTRRALWTFALGISVGAMLLLKGPAGLPTILGALAACLLLATGRRNLKKPWLWIGLTIGAALFIAWLLAVYLRVQSQHLPVDRSGAQEAEERMLLRSPSAVLKAITVPFLVLIYALPVSIGLPWSLKITRRLPSHSSHKNRIRAIAATIIASLLIGIFAGITNPRYSYVSMPLLAPLLAAAATLAWETGTFQSSRKRFVPALKIACILWIVAHAILTVAAFKKIGRIDPREHVSPPYTLLIATAAVSLGIGISGLLGSSPAVKRRAWSVAIMIVLLGIPFAEMKNAERTEFSGRAAGHELRQAMGESATVSVAGIIRDLPQILYYADVPVRAFGEKGLDNLAAAPGARWILLNEPEYTQLSSTAPAALSRVTLLRMPNDTVYLAWYDPEKSPATAPAQP